MPHIYAQNLQKVKYPFNIDNFMFHFEALDINNSNKRIIAVTHNKEKILITKQIKDKCTLLKLNNSNNIQSMNIIKQALNKYAIACNAKIISHNINQTKSNKVKQNIYLKNINDFINLSFIKNKTYEKLIIEIGFGSGRHILNLAKNNPNNIFIGIEIYRPAIEQVLNQINILKLENLFIINADSRILFEILPNNFIDEIYLHFPMPWDKNENRRVISKHFLENLRKILKKNAFLDLRTDSKNYYEYTLRIAKKFDIKIINDKQEIISKYEQRWINQQKNIYNIRLYNTHCIHNKNIKQNKIDLNTLMIKNILNAKILKSNTDTYFFNIKNIYKFENGYILFVIFGDYFAPNNIHLIVNNENNVTIFGNIIPSYLNKASLDLLLKFYGDKY